MSLLVGVECLLFVNSYLAKKEGWKGAVKPNLN
jgi:hypothetical protein